MKKIFIVLVICYLPVEAWAGQLHIHFVTLGEIALHGVAYLGTVVSVYASKQIVTVKIKKSWLSENHANVLDNTESEPGETVREFKIYTGIVWDNPNRSPVDHRIRGSLPISRIKPGQEVVIVSSRGYEMLPADSQTLQKLDLFFSPGKLENYKNSAPEGALYTDLNDYDLSEPALEAMCKRHLYAPSAFLAMEPYRMFDLSWKLGQCLPAREFDDWFSAIVTATTNGAIRLKLVDLARDSSLTGKLSAVTRSALIRTLDLKDPDQQNALRWFVQEDVASLTETPDPNRAEQTAEHALSLAASRSENASWDDYESLRKLSANLPEAGRIEFIKQMGRLVMSSHRATLAKEKYDEGLFEFFLEQIDQDPSIEYLPELVAIDLTHISKSSQNRVEYRVSILNAGVTIANKHPSSSREIYSSLNKWAEDEKIFTPAIIFSLDDEKPRDKQKRWISTLKKFKSLIK